MASSGTLLPVLCSVCAHLALGFVLLNWGGRAPRIAPRVMLRESSLARPTGGAERAIPAGPARRAWAAQAPEPPANPPPDPQVIEPELDFPAAPAAALLAEAPLLAPRRFADPSRVRGPAYRPAVALPMQAPKSTPAPAPAPTPAEASVDEPPAGGMRAPSPAPAASEASAPASVLAPVPRADNAPPTYSVASRRAREEGTVVLLIEIDAGGEVTAVSVVESSGHVALDDAALDAARAWHFLPALQDGTPVAGRLRLPVSFRLAR